MNSDIIICLYVVAISIMFVIIVILLLTRRHTTIHLYVPNRPPDIDSYPFPQFDNVDTSYTPPTPLHQTESIHLHHTNPTIPPSHHPTNLADQTHPSDIYIEMRGNLLPMCSNYPFSRSNSHFRGSQLYFSDE